MDRPNFHFRRREEKLDWKKLAALDVDQIARTVDYRALQDSIRQITYCDAGQEFDSTAADPNLVKVFRMAQLIIEYLLQSQDFLANNLASVERRLNTTLEELEAARHQSRRDQDELRDMRRGLRGPASSSMMTLTGHQRCQFCQKVFINTTYLQSHMMRRHNHMVGKQPSNQTLSTIAADHQPSPPAALEAELDAVRRRLQVAEQQLREERRRVAALESAPGPYPPPMESEPVASPPVHQTIHEEPEPPPEEFVPGSGPGSAPGSRQGSQRGSAQGSAAGSHQGSAGGSRQGSAGGSRQGSAGGSRQGSAGGSHQGSAGVSHQGSAGGSRQESVGGSRQGSGGSAGASRQESTAGSPVVASQQTSGSGSQAGSAGGSQRGSQRGSAADSPGQRDSQLAVLLEQQAAEIRQLREELSRQRQLMQQQQQQQPALLGGPAAGQQLQAEQPGSRVEQEIEKQARREVVALEGQMEAQERYWQSRLSAMRQRHDVEVEGMRRMLDDKNAASRGSAEYVNIDSSPSASPSPRLLRYVRRHQSPSPGPPPPGAQRPRPCLAARQQRRSRSVSGCRRLKFADDGEDEVEEGAARQARSSEALAADRAGGRAQARQQLETELSERLLELGIEPGTRRLPSGLMADKMKHLRLTRQVLGFGDLRRQVDQDLNQRLTKFAALPTKRSSKLALFAKDIMHRGAEMSRSLVSLGSRGRPPCTSATVDAQLMKRMVAAERAGRPRAASESPSSGRRAPVPDTVPDWPPEDRDWPPPQQQSRYQAASYEEEEDFRPRQGGRRFKFKANASKHILERFTRRGTCQSSLIKSTTIHRVESGLSLDGDGGASGGRYEKLREQERPPAGRQGSGASLTGRQPSAERRASAETGKPSAGFGMFQGDSEKPVPAARSGSVPSMSDLRPPTAAEDGFRTPSSRPESGSPAIPQIGSGPASPKQESFDDSETSNLTAPSPPPPTIPNMEPVEARPSGSANTLSTSQWNSAADGGGAADSSETETRASPSAASSSSGGEESGEEGGT